MTGGQAHESTAFELVLQEADQSLHFDDGSPVAWPIALAGDKGYRADWIDELLIGLGIKPVIPSKANEDRSQRRIKFDRKVYRNRNIVERVIGWLKECRRVFSRYEKTAVNYSGMIKMRCIQLYLKWMCC